MVIPTFEHELKIFDAGYDFVVGIDEAGIGPWAGPVVAGVVVLARDAKVLDGVRDSKTMTALQRGKFFGKIRKASVSFGMGEVSNRKIDEVGIAEATRKAIRLTYNEATVAVS